MGHNEGSGFLRIGALARRTGVSVRLLRYYEEQGLLISTRTAGGHRLYVPEAPATVARVRALLNAGLPTRAIRELTPCFVGEGPEVAPCVWDLLREHRDELDARMNALAEARAALDALLTSSARAATAAA
ncbi:MerR family transcriptional regulator [Streptomyces sp. 3MP-14]|uniref:MerR family transcriptional regulator n=1 Tax=Streptomyces mimosae TaxID=2586635 RepID=A0A5N6ACJ4_9ACTN|nr:MULTISPECIES: MerR family transcriptional regulator [Streptomyces]KAB8165773.1 MerR family transcriptional regulator [Streptomyces mimosae]KAB8176162.1 MerR family transcriptional regulator [Streptomyces sp. 3MP-14]